MDNGYVFVHHEARVYNGGHANGGWAHPPPIGGYPPPIQQPTAPKKLLSVGSPY